MLAQYRVFGGGVSLDFPLPNTTHTWLGAIFIAWRFRHTFDRIVIERADAQRDALQQMAKALEAQR